MRRRGPTSEWPTNQELVGTARSPASWLSESDLFSLQGELAPDLSGWPVALRQWGCMPLF
jgi:hypothetical protein